MAIRHREVFPDGSAPDSIDWRIWNDDHVGVAGAITQDQQDALDAANAPNTGNPFATIADIGSGAGGGSELFGDARDGDVVISVNTTMTGNIYAHNLTINAGVTLIPAGWAIYTTGTLTNNGTIDWSGPDGLLNDPGNGTPDISDPLAPYVYPGLVSGGGNTDFNGGSVSDTPGFGNQGGVGGDAGGNVGGTMNPYLPALGYLRVRHMTYDVLDSDRNISLPMNCGPGSGGAGSGGGTGGGGGMCGQVGTLWCRYVVNNGAMDGSGGNGANGTANGGAAGGGGGGRGATVNTLSDSWEGADPIVLGGNGGLGVGGGTNGQAGGVGELVMLSMAEDLTADNAKLLPDVTDGVATITAPGTLEVGSGLVLTEPTPGTALIEADIPAVPVKLFEHFTDGANVTTGETDLYSDTLAAGQLAANGDTLELVYAGLYAGSATATAALKLYFGGTAIFNSGALAVSAASNWTIRATLIRVSASIIRYSVTLQSPGLAVVAPDAVGELTGLDLTATQVVKITGQAAAVGAASNQITAKLGAVTYVP